MQSIYASVKAQHRKAPGQTALEVQEAVRQMHPNKIVGLGYVQNCLRTIRAAELKNANDTAVGLGKEMLR